MRAASSLCLRYLSSCVQAGYRCQAAWVWHSNNRSVGQPFVSDKCFGCPRGPRICFSMAAKPIQLPDDVHKELPSSEWILSCEIASCLYSPPALSLLSCGDVCFRLKHFCWHPGGFHAALALITSIPFQNPRQKIAWEKFALLWVVRRFKQNLFSLTDFLHWVLMFYCWSVLNCYVCKLLASVLAPISSGAWTQH